MAVAAAAGETATAIAEERGVSLNTVRTQLRHALQKTECHSLRDLGRLIARLAPG